MYITIQVILPTLLIQALTAHSALIVTQMECKNCGAGSIGRFCSGCGQKLDSKRIALHDVVHDVVHTFTHFEKGFLHTVKRLATHAGSMQKEYLHGQRVRHQKPFPMFFVAGTICALAMYFLYKSSSQPKEHVFFKNYYVILHACLLPVYAFSTWLFFKKSQFYYGEILVLIIYMVGFMSLLVIPINLMHGWLSNGMITLIELVVLAAYNVWTYLNFFDDRNRAWVIVKSIINIAFNFLLFNKVASLIIQWML